MPSRLVDFFDGGSAAGSATGSSAASASREATGHAAGAAATLLVQLGDDRSADALQLLLVVLELLLLRRLVAIEPFDDLLALVVDLLSVILADLLLKSIDII